MDPVYRTLVFTSKERIPGETISLLEYCLGAEKYTLEKLAERSYREQYKDFLSYQSQYGLLAACIEELQNRSLLLFYKIVL